MKSRFILIFIVFSMSSLADSYIFEGEALSSREKSIKIGEKYIVPKCRRWLLLDIQKFNSDLWFEIDGVLEIAESPRKTDPSHYIKGFFTYSNSNHPHKLVAIIHPESVVYLRGKTEFPVIIQEYKWFSSDEACK